MLKDSFPSPQSIPLVSIIMPAHNASRTIDSAIRSIAAQTYSAWELLVVEDHSRDDTLAKIASWARRDVRIRLLRTPTNAGPAEARNHGLRNARGRYIAFLDADDVWKSNKLTHQLQLMTENGLAFSYCSYIAFNDGESTGRLYSVPPTISFASMLAGSVVGCLTVMYDSKIVGIELFDDGRQYLRGSIWSKIYDKIGHEDYVAWMRILRKIEYCGLPPAKGIAEPLAYYRIGPASFSASKIKVAGYQFIIYQKIFGLSLLRSICYMFFYTFNAIKKRKARVPILQVGCA